VTPLPVPNARPLPARIGTKGTAPGPRPTGQDFLKLQFFQLKDDQPTRRRDRYHARVTQGLLTQNVRGFRRHSSNRETWMAGWKAKIHGNSLAYILLQETHVSSHKEAADLQRLWAHMWGRTDSTDILSFWSVTTSRVGGVAILLNPHGTQRFQREVIHGLDGRVLGISSPSLVIVNIYAPNHSKAREVFFSKLHEYTWPPHKQVIMAGDFNCVLNPSRDRITNGYWGRGASESPTLQELVTLWRLRDVVEVEHGTRQTPAPHTFLHQSTGSRLDRCYNSTAWSQWIVGHEVIVPHSHSDHLGFLTWIRNPSIAPITNPMPRLFYPIKGRNAHSLEKQVGIRLFQVLNVATEENLSWEHTMEAITTALREVAVLERQRAKRQRKKWRKRRRAQIQTLQDLIDYEALEQATKTAIKHGTYLLKGRDPVAIFKRTSLRDPNPTITDINSPIPGPPTRTVADKMSEAWDTLLGKRHTTITPQEQINRSRLLFTIPPQHKLSTDEASYMMRVITREEVAAAIEDLSRHKAAGSDRLNNDFYKDWKELLAPTLARVYNGIIMGDPLPASFGHAVIIPLKKKGDSPNAMDYRPISLLQTSYKIFTRIWAERVQQSLGTVINGDQNGFVRGRNMSNNIRIVTATLRSAYANPGERIADAPALVLLDYAKAYDTLDRNYVQLALAAFGYDTAFIHLVKRLHATTNASFLVNGDLSRPRAVHTGIRQGCPLAPLLFLIAAETLKHAIDQTEGIRGIDITGPHVRVEHKFSAFVDDSVVFLRQGRMQHNMDVTLAEFAALSGLRVQPTKSFAISLNTAVTDTTLGAYPVLQHGDAARYLGILIGTGDLHTVNWETRLDKLEKRLNCAAAVTASIPDRVLIWNAIGVASVRFLGKYYLPSASACKRIENIQRQYIWHGTTTTHPTTRHKLDSDIVHLPHNQGGLGALDYRIQLSTQAIHTILEWNTRQPDKYWAAVCTLANFPTPPPHVFPSASQFSPCAISQPSKSIYTVGLAGARWAMARRYPVSMPLLQSKTQLIKAIHKPEASLRWLTTRDGEFQIPLNLQPQWTSHQMRVAAETPPEIKSFWPTFPWHNNTWITDQNQQPLRKADYPLVHLWTVEHLRLRQTGVATFQFKRPTVATKSLTAAHTRQIARFIAIMACNYPAFALNTHGASHDRVYRVRAPPAFDRYEWRIGPKATIVGTALTGVRRTQDPPTITLQHRGWGIKLTLISPPPTPTHSRTLTSIATAMARGCVWLCGHPALQYGPTLDPPLLYDKKHSLRPRLTTAVQWIAKQWLRDPKPGLRKLETRLQTLHNADPTLHDALQTRTPLQLWRNQWGTSSYVTTFMYRLTVGAHNLRLPNQNTIRLCPHTACQSQSHETLSHVFWECTVAAHLWRQLWTTWMLSSRKPTLDAQKRSVFDPVAPRLGFQHRLNINKATTMGGSDTTRLLHQTWQLICRTALHQLWLYRNMAAHQGVQEAPQAIVNKIISHIYKQLERLTAPTWSIRRAGNRIRLRALIHSLHNTHLLHPPPPPTHEARLYYDGGSRGNPGPAGAGAIILLHHPSGWKPIWWDAHYLGPHSTNNLAEYTAITRGITAWRALDRREHLVIIGDSMLATKQLRGVLPTRHPTLQQLAHHTHNELSQTPHYELQHTYRAGNKMADWLANWAMDHQQSKTATSSTHRFPPPLALTLPTDTAHPWTATFRQPILRHMITKLILHRDMQRAAAQHHHKQPRPPPDPLPQHHRAKRRKRHSAH
jgi:ribonuclease HI/exonuclease III